MKVDDLKTLRLNNNTALGFAGNPGSATLLLGALLDKPEWCDLSVAAASNFRPIQWWEESRLTREDLTYVVAQSKVDTSINQLVSYFQRNQLPFLEFDVVLVGTVGQDLKMCRWSHRDLRPREQTNGGMFRYSPRAEMLNGKSVKEEIEKILKDGSEPMKKRIKRVMKLYIEISPREVSKQVIIRRLSNQFELERLQSLR